MDTPETAADGTEERTSRAGPSREHIDRRTAERLQSERGDGDPAADDPPPAPEGSELQDRLRRLGRWLRGPFHRAVTVGAVGGALVLAGCAADSDAGTAGDEEAVEESTQTPAPEPETATTDGTTATATSSACDDDQEDQVVLQDGVPTAQPADAETSSDLVEARITQVDAEVRLSTRRGASGSPPTDDSRVEFHLQSVEDPTATGVVQLEFPSSPAEDFTVRTGPTTSNLSEVETRSSRIGKLSLAAGIAVDDLPVAAPFRWFAVVAEGDTGDVCPGVTGFTTEASLPVFPDDEAGATTAEASTLEVTGVDYAFEGVPSDVEAGTRLSFSNGSDAEAHELVVVRLTDATPPVEEFLQLQMQEGMEVSELVGVSIALPGEQGRVTKGDLLLDEPGQYLLLCAIPLETPPQQVADHPFGPPPGAPPPANPPHFTRGMTSVVEVTE